MMTFLIVAIIISVGLCTSLYIINHEGNKSMKKIIDNAFDINHKD